MNDTDLDRELQQRMAYYIWTEDHVRYSLRERVSLWLEEPWFQAGLMVMFGCGCFLAGRVVTGQ